MKANIKPELKQSSVKLSRSEMKKWGPLTPGEWVAVAFVFFAVAMFYGDKSSPMHRQENEVVPQRQGEIVDLAKEAVVQRFFVGE